MPRSNGDRGFKPAKTSRPCVNRPTFAIYIGAAGDRNSNAAAAGECTDVYRTYRLWLREEVVSAPVYRARNLSEAFKACILFKKEPRADLVGSGNSSPSCDF